MRAVDNAEKVYLHHPAVRPDVGVVEEAIHRDAGVVYPHIYSAELLYRAPGERFDRRFVRYIGWDGERSRP